MEWAKPTTDFEAAYWNEGQRFVAGVDEVGRGSLAGPVVAAAVVFDKPNQLIDGVRDSKTLSGRQREKLVEPILRAAKAWGLGIVQAEVIDRQGIIAATVQAMAQAINECDGAGVVLIDGKDHALLGKTLTLPYQTIIKGDRKCYSIAAASIVAKVFRDRLMVGISQCHPAYLWEQNKGYGTEHHRKMIARMGLTEYHRKCFIHQFNNLT